MKKIYHLSTCSTCQRILKEIKPGKDVVLQDIKTEKITAKQLDEMIRLAGSAESLFSRVAVVIKNKLATNAFVVVIMESFPLVVFL